MGVCGLVLVMVTVASCGNFQKLEYKSPFVESCDSLLVPTVRHAHPVEGYSVMVPDSWILDITHPDSIGVTEEDGFISGLTLTGTRMMLDTLGQIEFMRAFNITHYTGAQGSLMDEYKRGLKDSFWAREEVHIVKEGRFKSDVREYVWILYRQDDHHLGVYHGLCFTCKTFRDDEYVIAQLGFYGEEHWERELCRMRPVLESFEF